MPLPLAIPIAAVALGVTGVGLRLRAMAKQKQALQAGQPAIANAAGVPNASPAQPPRPAAAPPPASAPITAVTTVAQAAAKAQGLPIPAAKPSDPTMADLAASLANPTQNKVSFDSLTVEQLQAAQDALDAQKATAAKTNTFTPGAHQAVVTTKDAPPSGDLIVRDAPNAGARQIGGADKNGIVTLLNADAAGDGVWAEIQWSGGRWPAIRGFSRKAFLKLI